MNNKPNTKIKTLGFDCWLPAVGYRLSALVVVPHPCTMTIAGTPAHDPHCGLDDRAHMAHMAAMR
jgi:hypothetical protein